RTHSSKFWPRGRMRRSAHVVVKRRGGGAATRRPAVTRVARANESVLPLAGFRARGTPHPPDYFHITQRPENPGHSKRNGLAGQCHSASGGGGAGERTQTRQSHAGPELAGMVRLRGGPAWAPGGERANRRHAGRIRAAIHLDGVTYSRCRSMRRTVF